MQHFNLVLGCAWLVSLLLNLNRGVDTPLDRVGVASEILFSGLYLGLAFRNYWKKAHNSRGNSSS